MLRITVQVKWEIGTRKMHKQAVCEIPVEQCASDAIEAYVHGCVRGVMRSAAESPATSHPSPATEVQP